MWCLIPKFHHILLLPTGRHPQEANTAASTTLPPLSPTTTAGSCGGEATGRVCSGLLDAMEGSARGGLLSLQCRVLRVYRRPITSCITLYVNKLIMCTYKVLSFAMVTTLDKWGITNVWYWVIHKSFFSLPCDMLDTQNNHLSLSWQWEGGQAMAKWWYNFKSLPEMQVREWRITSDTTSIIAPVSFSLHSPASQHGRLCIPTCFL